MFLLVGTRVAHEGLTFFPPEEKGGGIICHKQAQICAQLCELNRGKQSLTKSSKFKLS